MGTFLRGLFGPEPPIRVARETTFVTEPLAPDGLPDYKTALLAHLGPAPPPEENAAAGLLQVMWPLGIPAADRPTVCMALGIPNVPPAKLLLDELFWALTSTWDAGKAYAAAIAWPWNADEYPNLDLWLGQHGLEIDALVRPLNRPRYWLPSPTLLRPASVPLVENARPDHLAVDAVASMLACRAYGHLGERRHAAA